MEGGQDREKEGWMTSRCIGRAPIHPFIRSPFRFDHLSHLTTTSAAHSFVARVSHLLCLPVNTELSWRRPWPGKFISSTNQLDLSKNFISMPDGNTDSSEWVFYMARLGSSFSSMQTVPQLTKNTTAPFVFLFWFLAKPVRAFQILCLINEDLISFNLSPFHQLMDSCCQLLWFLWEIFDFNRFQQLKCDKVGDSISMIGYTCLKIIKKNIWFGSAFTRLLRRNKKNNICLHTRQCYWVDRLGSHF